MYSRRELIINNVYYNKHGHRFVIIYIDSSNAKRWILTVKFIDTGFITTVSEYTITSGNVKDYMVPHIFGIGYNTKGSIQYPKIYRLWYNMLFRCYSEKSSDFNSYGAIGVSVHPRWHDFYNFLNDVPYIMGYDEDAFNNGQLVLDKDYLQQHVAPGNKIYSLETCCFLDSRSNAVLRNSEKYRNKFTAISPDNTIYHVNGIKQFAREFKLRDYYINLGINEPNRKHKGWSFAPAEENINYCGQPYLEEPIIIHSKDI